MQSNDKDGSMVDGGDGCWLAAIEDDYLQSIGAEPDYEHQYAMERDASMRAMWGSFQESATSIAQLYRGETWAHCRSTDTTDRLDLSVQLVGGHQVGHKFARGKIGFTKCSCSNCRSPNKLANPI